MLLPEERDEAGTAFWRSHDLDRIAPAWLDAVGPDRFTVLVTDDTDRSLLRTTFESMLDLPEGYLDIESGDDNRSMSMNSIEVLRRLNALAGERGWPTANYMDLVRQGAFKELRATPPSEFELYDLHADPLQLESQHNNPDLAETRADLSAWLGTLVNCTGAACRTRPELSGTLVVTTTEEVVLRTLPKDVEQPKPSDWLGELSNQLLGRLKNQLSQFGLKIQVSTPVVLMGPRLSVFGSSMAGVRVYRFRLDDTIDRSVVVMVELRPANGLRLERVEQTLEVALEGTELFF